MVSNEQKFAIMVPVVYTDLEIMDIIIMALEEGIKHWAGIV